MGRPVRRVLFGSRGSVDGHLSRRRVAAPLQRPTRGLGGPRHHPLSGLAPGEVYPADRVAATPGGLLHHRFTLTGRSRRSALCCTVSRIAPGGCYPPPCPAEPGRSSACSSHDAAVRPTHSHHHSTAAAVTAAPEGRRPQRRARWSSSVRARLAAPMIPALFRCSAMRISARVETYGMNRSGFFETPPPTRMRSGEKRNSMCV